MKHLALGIIMTTISLSAAPAISSEKDEMAIKAIIQSVGTFADTGNFEALEGLYTKKVTMDYTSLNGGEEEVKTAKDVMTQWASMLPGFDATRHDVRNIDVDIDGKNAVATADVIASHYINDTLWQVSGNYRYKLQHKDDNWLITAHRFNLEDEKGSRDVFEQATKNAKKHPVSYIQRQQTQQAVTDFLTALEDKDMEKLASLWTDDAVQHMPYSPKEHPKRVSGKENIIELYSQWPDVSKNADFTSELVFYPMIDPTTVFAEYRGSVDIVPTGRKYDQFYGGLFHTEDGKIKLFREYYDPKPFKYAFGLGEEEKK